MKYILEIYYQGECIEHREQEDPLPNPIPGDQIYIEFGNPSYSEEHGNWWTVRNRSHLLFNQALYTLQLYCEPNRSRDRDYKV